MVGIRIIFNIFFRHSHAVIFNLLLLHRKRFKSKGGRGEEFSRYFFATQSFFDPLLLFSCIGTFSNRGGVERIIFKILFRNSVPFSLPSPARKLFKSRGVETNNFQGNFSELSHFLIPFSWK